MSLTSIECDESDDKEDMGILEGVVTIAAYRSLSC